MYLNWTKDRIEALWTAGMKEPILHAHSHASYLLRQRCDHLGTLLEKRSQAWICAVWETSSSSQSSTVCCCLQSPHQNSQTNFLSIFHLIQINTVKLIWPLEKGPLTTWAANGNICSAGMSTHIATRKLNNYESHQCFKLARQTGKEFCKVMTYY